MLLIVIFHAYYLTQNILTRSECQTDICICHGSSHQCRCYFYQTPYCDGYGPSQTCITNPGCLGCDDNSQCLTCISQKQFVDSYQNCVDCPEHCLTCTSESNCQSCITNNYYLDAGLCKQCEFPCQSCNSQYNCITCVSQQFYPISGLCRQCDSPCLTCLNQTQCLTCVDNSYYLDQITCVPCKSPCLTCSNQNLCFSCISNDYQLINGQCIVQCPLNCLICQKNQQCSTCQDGYYLNDSYSCVKCQDPCENCLSQELCITCQSLYYQKNQHCILCQQPCITCVDEQICSSCVDGYYLFNQTCNQCSINCLKCNQFGCYQCNKQSQLFNAQCIDCTIPMNHTLDICNYRDCHDGVWTHGEECDNGNSYGCINCTIQKGYYCINLNGYPSQCSRCIENCIQCEVDRFCLVCKDGYFLNPNHQCQECNVECRTCFYQPNNCSSCKINNLGFQSCHLCEINRGYYTDFENNQCYSKCGDNIKTIQEQCDDGNNFNGDGCSSKCQIEDGFYCIVFYQNHYQIFSINQLMILDLERIIQKIMCV